MNKTFKSDMAKVKGLGSGHSGTHHWLHQRFSAVMMLVLTSWIMCLIGQISGKELSEVIEVIQKPYNVLAISLFVSVLFYHSSLGMQVIIEDYVHHRFTRAFLIFAVKIISIITVVAMFIAVLYLMRL
jgi:succinate dehydrogenase / fumarate reductase, membrane anchor subunit